MDFFTSTDFQRFVTNAGRPYDANNSSHKQTKNNLLYGVIRKTTHWGELVREHLVSYDYRLTKHSQAHELSHTIKSQIFREYTWASLAKPNASGGNIYFTVGINQEGHFLVKLDYQRYNQPGRGAEQNLTLENRTLLRDFIETNMGDEAAGVKIKRSDLGYYEVVG